MSQAFVQLGDFYIYYKIGHYGDEIICLSYIYKERKKERKRNSLNVAVMNFAIQYNWITNDYTELQAWIKSNNVV